MPLSSINPCYRRLRLGCEVGLWQDGTLHFHLLLQSYAGGGECASLFEAVGVTAVSKYLGATRGGATACGNVQGECICSVGAATDERRCKRMSRLAGQPFAASVFLGEREEASPII